MRSLIKGLLIVCFLTSASFVNAQEAYHIGYLFCTPISDYGSTELGEGNFADDGWGILIESKNKISSFPDGLYLMLHLSYQKNRLDQTALESAYENLYPDIEYQVGVTGGDYTPINFMVIPYYEISLSENLYVGVKAGVGAIFPSITSFRILVQDRNQDDVLDAKISYNNKAAFNFLLGGSIEYRLNNSLALGITSAYSSANVERNASFISGGNFTSELNMTYLNSGLYLSILIP